MLIMEVVWVLHVNLSHSYINIGRELVVVVVVVVCRLTSQKCPVVASGSICIIDAVTLSISVSVHHLSVHHWKSFSGSGLDMAAPY